MRHHHAILALVATAIACAAPGPAQAAGKDAGATGFLCCNMRAFDGEIYDINYEGEGARIVPYGTPVSLIRQSRNKLRLQAGSERLVLENHYSRDLDEAAFRARYVVADDPREAVAGQPQKIRDAIASGRVTAGMTREQVRMSLGWPVSSENRDLDAPVWRFWLGSFEEFHVEFGDDGRVADLVANDMLLRRRLWVP